jgi:hypothetical protein
MEYSTVLDQLNGGLAVEWQLELVAQLEDEELLGVSIAVEVLLEGTGDVAVGLDDCMAVYVLRRKEWWSKRQVTYWVLAELMGLGMFRILGSQVFFQPDLVQNKLLSLMRKAIHDINNITTSFHQIQ